MSAWEYATVRYVASVENIRKDSAKYELLPALMKAEWDLRDWPSFDWCEEAAWITTPDAEKPEKRLLWDPTMDDYATSLLEIVNGLGADGWELVSETVLAGVMAQVAGHDRAGRQIDVRLWLKRVRAT